MRDKRAREIDRPPFKVLGNRTLLEIAEQQPRKLADLREIKGITDLIQRRMGRELMAAVREGRKVEHGPIPKLSNNGRRRLDRNGERRLTALKQWRAQKATELEIDPGVLCPNAALEAIAWQDPQSKTELQEVAELKGWFFREFGSEVAKVNREAAPASGAK